jgi:hypothetical protein
MTDGLNLTRLLALRQRSEQRALDVVTRSQHACRRAESEVEAAAAGVARHAAQARLDERSLVASVIGRRVSVAALGRLQAGLEALTVAANDLHGAAIAAQTRLQACEDALRAARADYRLRQRSATKLDLMVKRQTEARTRREAAVAEAIDEDRATGRRPPTLIDPAGR